MKKRKGEDVEEEAKSAKKTKVSGFAEGKENNNKPSELVRAAKGLLQKEQTRLAGLTKLLNALKESQNEESVLSIIQEGGEFQDVFKILEGGRHHLSQLEIQKCLEILESVLLFTAEDKQFSTRTGMAIVQRLLQHHLKLLYSSLNPGNPPEVIKATLRLLTAMVTQGTSAAKEVQRSFDFTLKSIGALPNKRDTKSVQDVRTCFIYFCLSFVMFGDMTVMKHILELKGFLQSVMKGLQFDPPHVVCVVLSTFQARVVQNAGIAKKTKVQFFNSFVLSQLANLYQYTKDTEGESGETVRHQVHELLLKICGSFKYGVCFSNVTGAFATRSNNPVLLRFLQNLSSVTSDVLVQQLVIKVLCCCQDVVKPFLSSLTATYEPRLSMPWVSNMNLVTKIYMALPQTSQMIERSGLKMTAKVLPSLINFVIPFGISRTVLNRGVQHVSALVKHTTLCLLVVVLDRAQSAAGCLASKSGAVLDNEHMNVQSETTLLQQFREEVFKALPDVKTVISLRQNLVGGSTKEEAQEDVTSPTILLAQSLKVIHGFQMLWPSVFSHINFDLKKLLPEQQEMNIPPIVQKLTLQILLQAPAGSLKWYQQKGKSSSCFVYSVLSLYTSTRSENIKNEAKKLLWKLLSETGLADSHTNEVDIWLTQLQQIQAYEGNKDSLLRFLDEVFSAVAAEPYVYTDIVIEMQAQAVAAEASMTKYGLDSSQCHVSDTSLPVSLLLVGALKLYSEMVCKVNRHNDKVAASSTGCIAQYMNCVVVDMIHSSANPTILCFAVFHYYGNTIVPEHLNAIRSVHATLLQYVNYWQLPGEIQMQDNMGYFKEQLQHNNKNVMQLHHFLDKTTVNSEQEKHVASFELYHLLEPLHEVQFNSVLVHCVEFCKQQLSADFSPLVRVLQVKNYKIKGCIATENMTPLLQALLFDALLWQVLGESIQDEKAHSDEIPTNILSIESESPSPLHSSWIQSLLMAALEKEPITKSISLCHHLLLYLHLLKAKLVTGSISDKQGKLQTAMLLCFQLLQYLLERFVLFQQNVKKEKTTAPKETNTEGLSSAMDSSNNIFEPNRKGLCDVEDMCRTVLHHPVILSCFLWKPDHSLPHAVPQDVGVQLTYNISNLLLTLLPNLTVEQKKILMPPFISKLGIVGMAEIQSAQGGNVVQSSQALYLLGLFHNYCDKEDQVTFISSLSQLPSNLLVTTEARETVPTVFLLTLLELLEGESHSKDKDSHSSYALSRNLELTEESLSVVHFKQLIKISEDVNSPQLDSIVLKLLQKSLMYVIASTTTLFDTCVHHPTQVRVAIAAHLVTHSPALRSHFELCCLNRSNAKKKKMMKADSKASSTISIEFKNHLREFLPLALSYVLSIRGINGDTSDKTRVQAVISHLLEVYWVPLWNWLIGDREGIFKTSEAACMELLLAFIHSMKRDDILSKKFNELLTIASLWDRCQLRICYQLLTSLCYDCSTNEVKIDITSKLGFACMKFLSSVLSGEGDKKVNEEVIKDALAHLESICKNSDSLSKNDDGCGSTWNSFVTNSLRYKFESATMLRTLRCVIKALYQEEAGGNAFSDALLPLNTLYEMVLSHSQFLEVILNDRQTGESNTKEGLVELMVTIVELSPSCCKSSHLPVLFTAYSASLSNTDQSILYLLNLYEKNNISFKNYRPFLWGPAAASHHQTAKSLGPSLWQQPSVTEVLEQLDVSKMNQSTVLFPQSRLLQPQVQHDVSQENLQNIYDPCFLLPLFSCLLAPNYQVDCRKFVEQGCLGFTLASLSSRDTHVRQAGYHVLSRFMTHLDGARFRERKQIFHLLKCLKNGITEANCRVSSVMVCFVARVAHILLKPENPFYLIMNSFLLQRPALDFRDLPLFYPMFNSSTMQHVAERSWMLQLLMDGMKDSPDYYLYKRRHVIELALSYHDSPFSDHHSQNLVTQLLMSALKIHPAAYDLAKNYGIVAWIHSLCYKSPERVRTSLNLLHSLWFTLHQGSIEKKAETASKNDGKDVHEEGKAVRLPPNVAQECALVCWTLLQQLRSCPSVGHTCTYLQLLASIATYLATNEQPSGMSRERIVSLLCLWCATFDETMALNQLLSSLTLSDMCCSSSRADASSYADSDLSNRKKESLSSLLTILTTWQPSSCPETNQSVLLVWRFGLLCCDKSSVPYGCLPSHESRTPVRLLSLLRWFRKRVVRDRALQARLVRQSLATDTKLVLQLYQVVLSHDEAGLLEHRGRGGSQKNSRFAVVRELNMICLVLFAAVQRIKQEFDSLTSPQPVTCQLISQEPYVTIITEGLEKVILPLFPDPYRDLEENYQDRDVVLQELISVFMQEMWMERPVPYQFLSFLLGHSDTGHPVVDSLLLALGRTKVITKWTQKQHVDRFY